VLLGLLLAVGAAEVALRVVHGIRGTFELSEDAIRARQSSIWTRSEDPELAYVHRPSRRGEGHAVTEASGLLHPHDVPHEKPAGGLRVAVVGDSVGAGLYLPHEQRFPAVLQRVMRDSGSNVEVLNFCVSGYSTLQEARLVETRLEPFDVDAVVVQYCMNDPVVTYTPMAWFVDPDAPAFYVGDVVGRGVRRLLGMPDTLAYVPKGTFESRGFWEQHYDPASASWDTVRRGLDRMAAWGREHDVPILFAAVPLCVPQDPAGETSRAFREQALEAARSCGLVAMDTQSAFALRPRALIPQSAGDPYHLNAEGHAVLAQALRVPVLEMLESRR
jgi:lysophospholipase L1-like esterase